MLGKCGGDIVPYLRGGGGGASITYSVDRPQMSFLYYPLAIDSRLTRHK